MVAACCLMMARASVSSALVSGAVRSLRSMGPSPRMSHSAERSGKVRKRRSASKVLRFSQAFTAVGLSFSNRDRAEIFPCV